MGERIAQREIESRFRGFVELFDALDAPIVPGVDDHNVYLVRDDLGRNGSVWREVDAEVTDLERSSQTCWPGNTKLVIAFNSAEGWSQDVSADIAQELRHRCDLQQREIPFHLHDYCDRYEGRYHDVQLPLPLRLVWPMAFQHKKPAAIGVKAPFPGFIEPALASAIDRVPSLRTLANKIAHRWIWVEPELLAEISTGRNRGRARFGTRSSGVCGRIFDALRDILGAVQPSGRLAVDFWAVRIGAMKTDQDLLLYPLITSEMPTCPACGAPMAIALHETRKNLPDFSTFRCDECARSEKFVCEE